MSMKVKQSIDFSLPVVHEGEFNFLAIDSIPKRQFCTHHDRVTTHANCHSCNSHYSCSDRQLRSCSNLLWCDQTILLGTAISLSIALTVPLYLSVTTVTTVHSTEQVMTWLSLVVTRSSISYEGCYWRRQISHRTVPALGLAVIRLDHDATYVVRYAIVQSKYVLSCHPCKCSSCEPTCLLLSSRYCKS